MQVQQPSDPEVQTHRKLQNNHVGLFREEPQQPVQETAGVTDQKAVRATELTLTAENLKVHFTSSIHILKS